MKARRKREWRRWQRRRSRPGYNKNLYSFGVIYVDGVRMADVTDVEWRIEPCMI
jgi:hypothetical protein